MAKRQNPADLEEVLRRRIREETQKPDVSLVKLAALADITHGQLSRFLRGERSLTLGTASRLCEVLGLGLVQVKHERHE